MDNIPGLINPALTHEDALEAFRMVDRRHGEALRRRRRQQRGVVLLTDQPISRVFLDGRRDRFRSTSTRERESGSNAETEDFFDAANRWGCSLDGEGSCSSSIGSSTLTWRKKVKPAIPETVRRPQTVQYPKSREKVIEELMRDGQGRPATTPLQEEISGPDLSFLDSLSRGERERLSASVLSVTQAVNIAPHLRDRETMRLVKSAPNLIKFSELSLNGNTPEADNTCPETMIDPETVPWETSIRMRSSEANLNLEPKNDIHEHVEHIESSEEEGAEPHEPISSVQGVKPLRSLKAAYIQEERKRAVEHLRLQKIVHSKLRDDSKERQIILRERKRMNREKKWAREKAVHVALQKVGTDAKQYKVNKIKQERESLRQQREAMEKRNLSNGIERIQELKQICRSRSSVTLPKANMSADMFPDRLKRYLDEENSLTASRDFRGSVSDRKTVLGGGFKRSGSKTKAWAAEVRHEAPQFFWD